MRRTPIRRGTWLDNEKRHASSHWHLMVMAIQRAPFLGYPQGSIHIRGIPQILIGRMYSFDPLAGSAASFAELHDNLGSRMDVELVIHLPDMSAYRIDAHAQFVRDFLVWFSFDEQVEHLLLTDG